MASAGRPTTSPFSYSEWPYEVFLSFRGEDTRRNFIDHLYTSLVGRGIRTFRDEEGLERGEEIGTELVKAIKESRLFLVVLSDHFANSRWCLDELAKIMEQGREKGRTVFPIFYRVDPSDVRRQRAGYGEALAQHEKRNTDRTKIQAWRTALTEIGNLAGWHVGNGTYEADVIKHITDTLLAKLSSKLLHVEKNLIGMDDRLEEMISQIIDPLSNDVRMIGICGLGGIGKTTIAKVLYNEIGAKFMITCFIANVREVSNSRGLFHLQKQLLHSILPERKICISNTDEGIRMIKDRLCWKKVLLLLDDVDHGSQLEALAGDRSWFGQGSRIIITTREKRLLKVHEMDALYEAKILNQKEAVELFSWHAFKQKHPKEDYEKLSNRVVSYVNGLPLGLKVLGSFLFGKTIHEWESELQKLECEPNQEIQTVLKRSYDELGDSQKEIFLDVAFFFHGDDKDFVTKILDACRFYAESGIGVLCDKCLITILDNKIWMHDLLQQMGRDIVRQECPKYPGKRSRLCYHHDVHRVLTRKMATETIEGIVLNLFRSKQLYVTTEAFAKMNNLRLLKIYWDLESASIRDDNKVILSKDFEFPSYELKYLHWHGYSLEHLPANFCAEDLVEIDVCYSSLKQLWESDMILQKLSTIRLSCCEHLIKIPDFSISAPNLEKLVLDGCSSLVEVHPTIGKLNKLVLLDLKNCKMLSHFPSVIEMKALEILNFSGCSELKKFPDIQGNMECLLELYLASTAIEELPSSIGHLTGLVLLDLKRCKNLKSLPKSICKLQSLKNMFLSGCSKLESFPEVMENMEHLKALFLDGTSIQGLPSSIERLKGLVLLNMRKCKNLVSLPDSMCNLRSLETLIVSDCSQLDKLPKNLGSLHHLVQLHADGTAITQTPASIVLLRKLQVLIYPGSKILTSISLSSTFSFWLLHNKSSDGICLRLPSCSSFNSFTNLDLSNCKLLEGAIPDDFGHLKSLKKSGLMREKFGFMPIGNIELTSQEGFQLGQCQRLAETPELQTSAVHLDIRSCTSLSSSSSSVSMLQWLQFLFHNYFKPVEDQSCDDMRDALVRHRDNFMSSDGSIPSLVPWPVLMQKILENVVFSIILPGSTIVEWIWQQNVGSSIKIELPTDWCDDDFLGFALCSVLEHLPDKIICNFNFDILDYGESRDFHHDCNWEGNNVESEHVWIGYQPCSQLRMFQSNDPNEWSQIEISFEATHRFVSRESNMVKKCGVRLIYAEDLRGGNTEMTELTSPLGIGEGPSNDAMLEFKGKRLQE